MAYPDDIDPRKTTIEDDNRATTVDRLYNAPTTLEILPSSDAPQTGNNSRATIYKEITQFQGYAIEKRLDSGGEADIYVVSKDNKNYILKLYHYSVNPKEDNLAKIRDISDKNPIHFVRLYDNGRSPELDQRAYEIMEYVENGSLDNYIQSGEARNFDFNTVVSQISEAIEVLRELRIVHSDIKPPNILVRSVSPLRLIISDFGISTMMNQHSIRLTTRKLSEYYAAPEQLSGHVTFKTDYWAMGMVLYEIIDGKNPFEGLNASTISYNLSTHKKIDMPKNADDRTQLLLKGLLTHDDKKRWGYDEVTRWLRGESPDQFSEHEEYQPAAPPPLFLEPFKFQDQNHDSLYDLAITMSSSDTNWQAAGRYLSSEYFTRTLKSRSDIDFDITNKLENITCDDSNEYVFRFIHTFNKDLPISYRGLALTSKNLLLAFSDNKADQKSAVKDFVDRTLNNRWDSLLGFIFQNNISKNNLFSTIDPIFISIVLLKYNQTFKFNVNNKTKLTELLMQAVTPKLYYWGFLDTPSVKQRTIKYKLNSPTFGANNGKILNVTLPWQLYCSLHENAEIPTKKDFLPTIPTNAVLPQGIAKLLRNIDTFGRGIRELKERITTNRLLIADELKLKPSSYNPANNVFNGPDTSYDQLLNYLRNTGFQSIFKKLSKYFFN
jgi:serine/threonine protein kinase